MSGGIKRWWAKHRWQLTLFGAPAITGLTAWGASELKDFWQKLGCVVVGIITNIAVAWATRPEQFDKEILTSFLFGVLDLFGISAATDCRIMLWIRDGEEHVRAATDYAPKFSSPSLKRLHLGQGVVGEALRMGKPALMIAKSGTDDAAYRADAQKKYGFSEPQARRLDPSRRLCVAIPVLSPNQRVEAIIYIDFPDVKHLKLFGRTQSEARAKLESIGKLLYPLLKHMKERSN